MYNVVIYRASLGLKIFLCMTISITTDVKNMFIMYFAFQDAVKTNHRAQVVFKFMHRPEYVRVGSRLLFRQGTTKGVGEVIKVYPYTDTPARQIHAAYDLQGDT